MTRSRKFPSFSGDESLGQERDERVSWNLVCTARLHFRTVCCPLPTIHSAENSARFSIHFFSKAIQTHSRVTLGKTLAVFGCEKF